MNTWGWGRFPVVDGEVVTARDAADAAAALAAGPLIPRGLGRSYGDSSLGERMLDLTGLDSLLAFDEVSGELSVEAGVSLSEIIRVMLPRGWFLPVTPGTRFVTVGGAIASDVHGKNHHQDGTFTDHVTSLRLLVGSGEVLTVSRSQHPDLFHATCGGMGLTGVILAATVRLLPVASRNVEETVVKAPDLAAALAAFAERGDATYSVGWIDLVASGATLGRSLVMTGEHATDGDLRLASDATLATVPFSTPSRLVNRFTVSAFNKLYYARVRQPVLQHTVGFEPFFYPLDRIGEWNRLLGSRGFLQYQFAIPFGDGPAALREVIERIAAASQRSSALVATPIAVLKIFGESNDNLLSFPMAGYTLALDFAATPAALRFCDELDRLVLAAGGRLYLTKDSRMSPAMLAASYPRLEEFERVRERYGATGVFTSTQSKRLGLS
ncbi:FAD-binding protein [Nocardioides sp.]|uniref:FAD-binding oxidoreductase n=1 Tax=Nocardioides sp. TaxID=35761 RepID=UPI0039E719D2